jgi:TolA-binding protein
MSECPPPWMLTAAASGSHDNVKQHALCCDTCAPLLQAEIDMRAIGMQWGSLIEELPSARRSSLAASILARSQTADIVREPPVSLAGQATQEIVKIDPLGDIEIVAITPWRRFVSSPRQRTVAMSMAAAAAGVALWLGLSGGHGTPTISTQNVAAVTSSSPVITTNRGSIDDVALERTNEPAPPPSIAIAKVRPQGMVTYQQAATSGDVILSDGALEIDGGINARVSVSASNASMTGVGARAVARAKGGVMQSISVFAGSVEVTSAGKQILLVAGEQWTWAPPSATATTAKVSDDGHDTPVSAQRVAPRLHAKTTQTSPSDSPIGSNPQPESATSVATPHNLVPAAQSQAMAFRDAFLAMRAGHWQVAAAGFQKLTNDPVVGEDACFWTAVTTSKLGDAELARRYFVSYLERFPSGGRVGEAHANLGRLLQSTDRNKARHHYTEAARDSNPNVRASAAVGLETLRKDANGTQ